MYGSATAADDLERTEFRKAEKKYKLYYDNKKRKKQPRPVDLSEVIDFRSILESYKRGGGLPDGVFAVNSDFQGHVFGLESRPGFYFIPGVLSLDEQCQWIRESLESFPQPPNRTNHNAVYGPIENLFDAAKDSKVFVQDEPLSGEVLFDGDLVRGEHFVPRWRFSSVVDKSCKGDSCKPVLASVLLQELQYFPTS